ncbi:MAG: methyltransferase domain-containing protein [Candidatus Latescibacteria bacterium]|nr:methyltransferase domain-containing protein [bacterium]MBD3423926.1 methyltransferase domain-containing protein [Candidatus Latescibacterota bacterium]
MKETRRTPEQIREHYLLEKKLAGKLKNSTREERKALYTELYNELYQKLPHHPRWTRKTNYQAKMNKVNAKMRFLNHYLNTDTTFMEIGPGDCLLAREISGYVRKVYALDVSDQVTRESEWPENFEFILSDGIGIPVENESVDIVFSNQMMEHLHPDDALDQVKNIYNTLKPGGKYLCITPNRLNGPHDISRYFDEVATCFHLKEYTITELVELFSMAGFSETGFIIRMRDHYSFEKIPFAIIRYTEKILEKLPHSLARKVSRLAPIKILINCIVVAKK